MDIQALSGVAEKQTESSTSTQRTAKEDFSAYLDSAQTGTVTLDSIFAKAADKYNVDVNLLKAIAKQESNFHSTSTSHAGAQGIMQLMPATAEYLGVDDPYDPEQNIMGGAKYISRLLKQYDGNITLALAAYNAGSGNVKKYGGVPPFKETQNYVKKVTRYYKEGVTIPEDCNTVTVASGSGDSTYEVSAASQSPAASEQKDPAVSILSLTKQQENYLASVTQEEELLDALKTLLSKLENGEDQDYSYEEYARFLKVYLDGYAVSALSSDDTLKEDLQEDLADAITQTVAETGTSADMVYASQSLNYNKAVLGLLTGSDLQK
ncbi:MAG: lytic transglycosylase domain-containing protein [Lachnospiraceae bacterium]